MNLCFYLSSEFLTVLKLRLPSSQINIFLTVIAVEHSPLHVLRRFIYFNSSQFFSITSFPDEYVPEELDVHKGLMPFRCWMSVSSEWFLLLCRHASVLILFPIVSMYFYNSNFPMFWVRAFLLYVDQEKCDIYNI